MKSDRQLETLLKFDTCTLSDALDRLDLPGAIAGIAPLGKSRRAGGRAVTTELAPVRAGTAYPPLGLATLKASARGDVIVVANGARTAMSAWGGLLSRAARAKGIAGVVVDGAARDRDEIDRMGLAVFARAVTPISARGRVAEVAVNGPVRLGDTTVRPGDYVIADDSGVVVVRPENAKAAIDVARQLQARESRTAQRLEAGDDPDAVLEQVFGNPHGSARISFTSKA